MLKNYFLITFRSLFKNRTYVLINLFGLGIAISCCIVGYLNYDFSNKFDEQHLETDGIYRVNFNRIFQGKETHYGIVPMPIAHGVAANVPDDVTLLRYYQTYNNVLIEDEWQQTRIAYADPEFLQVFNFPMLKGRYEDLNTASDIILTYELAEKYFGDSNPINKHISHKTDEGVKDYKIVGVLKHIPLNSSFQFEALTVYDALLPQYKEIDETSYRQYTIQFAYLPEGKGKEALISLYDSYIDAQHEARDDFHINQFYLDPLEGMAKRSRSLNVVNLWILEGLPESAVLGPVIMSIFMILMACFNFTNTSLALSSKRLKEIGIRKVLGGRRKQLIAQFLGENLILCLMGLIMGLLIAEFLVPAYSSLWPFLEIELNLTKDATFLVFLVTILLFTGLFAGAYPAFYVSGFQATRILKGTLKVKNNGIFAMSLLWLQFATAIVAVIGGYLFYQNANYQKDFDMGFNQHGIISLYFEENSELTAFKNTINQHPKIITTGQSEHQFFGSYYVDPVQHEDVINEVNIMHVSHDYFDVMGMSIINGRSFIRDSEADRSQNIVVNENFVEAFGWKEPIGKRIVWADSLELFVVGVVKDFISDGLWNPVEPVMIRYNQAESEKYLAIQADADQVFGLNDELKSEWKKMFPDRLYTGDLLNEGLAEAANVNNNILIIFLFQAILGTLLAISGLYTLVSINIVRRTKEIGVRKVLGASMLNIAKVINSKYVIVYLISSVTGSIMAYYLVGWLLGNIWAYHVPLKPSYFITSVLFLFTVSAIVVGQRVFKAASANPALSLRDE